MNNLHDLPPEHKRLLVWALVRLSDAHVSERHDACKTYAEGCIVEAQALVAHLVGGSLKLPDPVRERMLCDARDGLCLSAAAAAVYVAERIADATIAWWRMRGCTCDTTVVADHSDTFAARVSDNPACLLHGSPRWTAADA